MEHLQSVLSGGNGFIGGHLTQRLERLGHKVIPLDREFLKERSNLKFFLSRMKPDYIFHLATYGNHYFQTNEAKTFDANLVGTFNLLWASKDLNYKAFLNFSTTNHNLEMGTFYGATKMGGEYLTRAFIKKYKKPIINIRPYSVYGEREWEFRFIPTLVKRLKNNKPIMVSDVDHDWIYIEDFIDGLIKIIKNPAKYTGREVGIGTGKRISNSLIAKRLQQIAKTKVKVLPFQKRSYEVPFFDKLGGTKKEEIFFPQHKISLTKALKRIYDKPNFLKK